MKTKKIALIGVSHDTESYGFKMFHDLLKAGYHVYAVNPKGGEILGHRIYSNMEDIPRDITIDLVITVVPPKVTEKLVDACIAWGIGEIWMQPGSESELAIEEAEENGIKVTHNECFMVREGLWETPMQIQ